MSWQRTLGQQRAEGAWKDVVKVRDQGQAYAREYGQLARSAPADVQANGLGQTLALWRAKGKGRENSANWQLHEHVSAWVMRQMKVDDRDGLLAWIMAQGTSTSDYRRATAEAIAFLTWLKRFAEAELGAD